MCIGGAATGFLAGQSGSPNQTALEGRWGFFGHYWGSNRPLPTSPVSFAVAAALVFAGGIALLALAG